MTGFIGTFLRIMWRKVGPVVRAAIILVATAACLLALLYASAGVADYATTMTGLEHWAFHVVIMIYAASFICIFVWQSLDAVLEALEEME